MPYQNTNAQLQAALMQQMQQPTIHKYGGLGKAALAAAMGIQAKRQREARDAEKQALAAALGTVFQPGGGTDDKGNDLPGTPKGQFDFAALPVEQQSALLNSQFGQALIAQQMQPKAAGTTTLTPDEVVAMGLPENTVAQRGPKGKVSVLHKPEKPEENKSFQREEKLRGEFIGQTKSFAEQNAAFGRIVASAQDPSPAGDIALVFNFMKVLDPGSTVREGEYANAKNAGSIPQRVRSLYNSVVDGTLLEDKQRKDFLNRADKLYQDAAGQYKKQVGTYERLAKNYGLDPANVIIDRMTAPSMPTDMGQDEVDPILQGLPPGSKVIGYK